MKKTSCHPKKVSAEADTPVSQPKKHGQPCQVINDMPPVVLKVWNMFMFVEIVGNYRHLHMGGLVLESPVQSGLLAQNEKTKTKTSPHIF